MTDDNNIAEIFCDEVLPCELCHLRDGAQVAAERRHHVHGMPEAVQVRANRLQEVPGLVHARKQQDGSESTIADQGRVVPTPNPCQPQPIGPAVVEKPGRDVSLEPVHVLA